LKGYKVVGLVRSSTITRALNAGVAMVSTVVVLKDLKLNIGHHHLVGKVITSILMENYVPLIQQHLMTLVKQLLQMHCI
jgi:hypothetical protein